jgi:hypothetical protein
VEGIEHGGCRLQAHGEFSQFDAGLGCDIELGCADKHLRVASGRLLLLKPAQQSCSGV